MAKQVIEFSGSNNFEDKSSNNKELIEFNIGRNSLSMPLDEIPEHYKKLQTIEDFFAAGGDNQKNNYIKEDLLVLNFNQE